MLYEIHMIKNYPPTNLNRDDTGAPKTCVFGGTTRGRISSQCLKRSWRTSDLFKAEIGADKLGIRTRKLPELVANRLLELGVAPEYVEAVKSKISGFGNKDGKETKDGTGTAQMVFYAPQDIEAVALAVKDELDACKTLKDVEKLKGKDLQNAAANAGQTRPVTLDIALFGRMVTSDAFRDVEAAMQVAHAISTNKVNVESDYFTAMDDLLRGDTIDEKGAGMIGDVDYNASCYYLYASLDTDALKKNLQDADNADALAASVLPALLRTMAFTNPSGKQNSFAGHVLPSCFLVECKEQKLPVSLVNAFVEPVKGQDQVKESIQRLADETDLMNRNFGLPVRERLWFCVDKYSIRPDCATKVCASFPELVEDAAALLN